MSLTSIPVMGETIEPNIDVAKEYISLENGNETNATAFITYSAALRINSRITFQKAPLEKRIKVNKLLRLKFLPIILPIKIVILENVSFTIKYRRDIERNWSLFSYETYLGKYDGQNFTNETNIRNEKHTVRVTNFTGAFVVTKSRFSIKKTLFIPKIYVFAGYCEKAEIL